MTVGDPAPVSCPRVIVNKIDESLVRGVMAKDIKVRDEWLVNALRLKNNQALAAVEEAIARLAGRADIRFYQTGGLLNLSGRERKAFFDQVVELARMDALLKDPIKTQYNMVRVGKELNPMMLSELVNINAQALHIVQLLGIQMQLAVMVERQKDMEE